MTNYLAKIEHRVAGIPCLIGVTHYHNARGSFSYNACSDLDFYGYKERDYVVLDRRGRPAPWLEKKIDAAEAASIEECIDENFV